MTGRTPRVSIAVLALAFFLSAFPQVSNGQDGGRPLRILIDASKDGGLWWFPQAGPFDPGQHHQGTRIASQLKDRGWEVTELGRGEIITESTLSGYDVIVMIQPYFSYRDSEQRAYVTAVDYGARVLLLGPGRHSGVHAAFGFRFMSSRFGSADSWTTHPLNGRIEDMEVLWTPGFTTNRAAVPLASISEGSRKLSIVTYLPAASGSGGVLYVGHSDVLSRVTSIQEHLVDAISILGYGPIATPDPSVVSFRGRASHIGAPNLGFPLPGQLLDQPAAKPWEFDWDDVPGAVEYELVVSGANASVPLTRLRTSVSEFRPKAAPRLAEMTNLKKPYIANHNLYNWNWRVRARGEDGQWGPWSKAGTFNVRPDEE